MKKQAQRFTFERTELGYVVMCRGRKIGKVSRAPGGGWFAGRYRAGRFADRDTAASVLLWNRK